jgi:hypothetical protein
LNSSNPTDDDVLRAIDEAVLDAYAQHKRAGTPIVVWRNDQVVWIPAEEIEIRESANGPVTDWSSSAE